MKFIELFAGLGGLGYGLMQAGMECVGYVEIDKFAHHAYEILHDPRKEMWSAYDVRDVTDDDIRCLGRERGPISLIAAGFPCQTFSVAGKREGFADQTRGTLFFEIIRFASILRPEILFLENVDGLRNHDGGRTLGIILSTLDELGYMGGWQVLNSKDFGVPQNRERIFIVASLGGRSAREVFPIIRENSGAIEIVGRLDQAGHDQRKRVYDPKGLSPCLNGIGSGGNHEPKVLVTGQLDSDSGGTGKVYDPEGIAPTQLAQHGNAVTKIVEKKPTQFSLEGEGIAHCLDAGYAKGVSPGDVGKGRRTQVIQRQFAGQYGLTENITGTLQASRVDKVPMVVEEPRAVLTPDRLEKSQNGRRMKEPGEPMYTLTAQDLHGVKTGYRIRKLTPLECFRLQSWPDEWYVKLKLYLHPEYIDQADMTSNDITEQVLSIIRHIRSKEGISDSQLYKMAGNGVTSIVACEVGRRLMSCRIKSM